MSVLNDISIVAVDFDGTLCSDEWPEIGTPNTKLIKLLIREKELRGGKIILWTCRTGKALEEAVSWCKEQGLIFDAVNDNIPEVKEKFGGDSRKITADIYIDDKSYRCVLKKEN